MTQQQVFTRAFPAMIERTGQRTLTGKLVPYDTIADVLDVLDDGKPDIYREGFKRGAFEGQLQTGARNKGVLSKIGLVHRHEGGLGYLGPFTALRDAVDGLYGDIMVLPTKADDVGALIEAGIDELSVEFRLRPGAESTFTDDSGVRWRTRVHLDQVALEPKGAYSGAQVLAYRTELDEHAREVADREAAERAEKEKLEAERVAAEAAATEALERKRSWEELTGRVDAAAERQEQIVKDYGITRQAGFGSVR